MGASPVPTPCLGAGRGARVRPGSLSGLSADSRPPRSPVPAMLLSTYSRLLLPLPAARFRSLIVRRLIVRHGCLPFVQTLHGECLQFGLARASAMAPPGWKQMEAGSRPARLVPTPLLPSLGTPQRTAPPRRRTIYYYCSACLLLACSLRHNTKPLSLTLAARARRSALRLSRPAAVAWKQQRSPSRVARVEAKSQVGTGPASSSSRRKTTSNGCSFLPLRAFQKQQQHLKAKGACLEALRCLAGLDARSCPC